MKNGNLLIALAVGGVVGFVIGKSTTSKTPAPAPIAAKANANPAAPGAARAPEDANTVYKVPLRDAQVKGAETAKITIVEFSEYQCPFCARVGPTLKQIEDTYGKDVRIAFKHNPLPFHAEAPLASEAALAAGEQGKFWEFGELLFKNQQNLKREDLEKYAGELGLDLGRFKAALDSGKFKDQIDRDKKEAATFGARGTPSFFINGRKVRGAQPFDSFKKVIDEELQKANAALARGVSASGLYAELTKDGLSEAAPPPAQPQQQKPSAPEPPPGAKVSMVKDIDAAPFKGPKNAKVTIVLFSEFQCPFCSRAVPTEEQIVKEYPKDVRFVFKHQPLPFHPNAMPAAIASVAAQNQGKFWEFHDLAFKNQQALSPEKYKEWAKEIGLNMAKFEKDIADPKTKAFVEADSKYGSSVGADGTPTFYINGRELAGAMPFGSFKSIIDEEIKKADELLAKGTKADKLYEAILEYNQKNAPKAPAAAAPVDDSKPVKIELGQAPVKGDAKAPITVVIFSDFQCPFCSRVAPTLKEVEEKYKGKVKFAWKNQPLSFHENAMPAAIAAHAAGQQGKFWEFHDKLFANQQNLNRETYEKYAQELGLNLAKFKSSLEDPKLKSLVEADSQVGSSIGANGTPTFFINGRKLVGAQPFDAFAKLIDEELKK